MEKKYAYLHWGARIATIVGVAIALLLIASAFINAPMIDFWSFIGRIVGAYASANIGLYAGMKLSDLAEKEWQEIMYRKRWKKEHLGT